MTGYILNCLFVLWERFYHVVSVMKITKTKFSSRLLKNPKEMFDVRSIKIKIYSRLVREG